MAKLYLVQMTKNKLRFVVPFAALFVLIPALAAWIRSGPDGGGMDRRYCAFCRGSCVRERTEKLLVERYKKFGQPVKTVL